MIKTIVIPILITLLVSLGVGYIFTPLFWQGFVGALIIQFLGYNIWQAIKPVPQDDIAPVESAVDELIDIQTANISCPCGRNTFSAPIFLHGENIFTCEKCKSKFRVEMSFESIILTEPLNLENAFNVLKGKEQ